MAYQPRVKQVANPFGKKPDPIKKPSKYNKTKYSNNNNKKSGGSSPYADMGGSGNQSPTDWVSVKSSAYSNNNKPVYSYQTNKAPKKFNIKPKNKALPSNIEPNAMWHSNPKQDPTATVCGICNKPFQNSWITVDGTKVHKGCFKCSKCGGYINHEKPSSYTKLNDITLHFREKFICSKCKVQNKYGVYGKCTACNKDLPSVYFEDSDGYKFHNECFNCLDCGKSLANFNERYFSASGNDRYCKKCRQKQMWPNKK